MPTVYTVLKDGCIALLTELMVKEYLYLSTHGLPADGDSALAATDARIDAMPPTAWLLYALDALASPKTGQLLRDLANLAQDKICPTPGLLSPFYRGAHLDPTSQRRPKILRVVRDDGTTAMLPISAPRLQLLPCASFIGVKTREAEILHVSWWNTPARAGQAMATGFFDAGKPGPLTAQNLLQVPLPVMGITMSPLTDPTNQWLEAMVLAACGDDSSLAAAATASLSIAFSLMSKERARPARASAMHGCLVDAPDVAALYHTGIQGLIRRFKASTDKKDLCAAAIAVQDGAGLEAGAGETDGASGAGDERSRIGGGESWTGEVEADGGTSGQIWAALARHPANPRWSARVAARAPTMASSHIFVESLKSSKYSAMLKDT